MQATTTSQPTPLTLDRRAPLIQAAGTALFMAACLWTLDKGAVGAVHLDELYVWLNTYADGYVRRGLLGTLLQPWTLGASPGVLRHGLLALNLACLCGVVLLAFSASGRSAAPGWPARRLLTALLLATSPFLGQLAHHAGYPDGLIALLLCGAAAWLPRANGPAIGLLLLVSCLFHELCFLLLAPMAAFTLALRRDVGRRHLAWAGAAFVLAVLATLAAHPPGARLTSSLVRAGLSTQAAQAQVAEALARPLFAWLSIMQGLWRDNLLNAVAGMVYAGLPGVLILLLYAKDARLAIRARTASFAGRIVLAALYVASGMAACGVLAIALDLSRVTSFTTLTAFLTAAWLPVQRVPAGRGRVVIAAAVVAASAYALCPVFDLHFGYGRVVNLPRVETVCRPCAATGRSLLETYDRGLAPALARQIEHDPALGN